MNRIANQIKNRLSLRPPQSDTRGGMLETQQLVNRNCREIGDNDIGIGNPLRCPDSQRFHSRTPCRLNACDGIFNNNAMGGCNAQILRGKEEIGRVFAGFQKYLYQLQEAA